MARVKQKINQSLSQSINNKGRDIPRVGFDFDGVIAYNPLRILRRPAMWASKKWHRTKELHYPVPKANHFRWAWGLLHETSFFPAKGFAELKQLLKDKKITAYIITGRYAFLDASLLRWLQKYDALDLFEGVYLNDKNEQPHEFKERLLKELKLDYYVEDNWDIVCYLNSKFKNLNSKQIPNIKLQYINKKEINFPKTDNRIPKTEVHWLYNILDRNISYNHKYPHLKSFVDYLKL